VLTGKRIALINGLLTYPTTAATYHQRPHEAREQLYLHSLERVIYPAARVQHLLKPLGFAPLFWERRLIVGQDCLWALMPVERDPLVMAGEILRIPRRQLRRLHQLERSGLNPDRLYLAHELPLDAPVYSANDITADLLRPQLPPGALKLSRQLGFTSALALKTASLPVRIVGTVAGVGLTGTSRLGAQVGQAIPVLLDPVLLGAVVQHGRQAIPGEMAIWYEILRWDA
jgi:hypothetical protein